MTRSRRRTTLGDARGLSSTGADARPSAPRRLTSETTWWRAGAAMLPLALERRWLAQDLDSRILRVTRSGRREFRSRFGVEHSATPEVR